MRKLIPGQPAFMEVAGSGVVFVAGIWALLQKRQLPLYLSAPLIIWVCFEVLYVIPSVAYDWRVGAAAAWTRIVPMLMATIAYATIRNWQDIERASLAVCTLAPLHLPVVIIGALFGNKLRPVWLQPIVTFRELGLEVWRGQFWVSSGVFATPTDLSQSALAISFLALAAIVGAEKRAQSSWKWWAAVAAAGVIIYLTARRTLLLWFVVGLAGYFIGRRRLSLGSLAALGLMLAVGLWAGVRTPTLGQQFQSRTDSLKELSVPEFQSRLVDVFLKETLYWIDLSPFGNFLGYAGPEARALDLPRKQGIWRSAGVEVGGAYLVSETGIVGLMLMPLIIGILLVQVYRRARGLPCQRQVALLTLFQISVFAHFLLKTGQMFAATSIIHLLFWAVPGMCAALIVNDKRAFAAARFNTRHA